MSRSLNVDRMRRYMARTTPDLLRLKVDPMAPDWRDGYEAELARWQRRMAVKHPSGSRIDLRTWEDFPTLGYVVEARVRP